MYLKNYQDTNDDYYNNSYPFFENNLITYRRKEKFGFTSNYSKNVPIVREILINQSADVLLGLCNGERTPDEICDEALKIFNGVSKEILQRDLKILLFQYSKVGLVEWLKRGNPFMKKYVEKIDEQYTISIANENELLKIKAFCLQASKANEIKYIAPTRREEDYKKEIILREKIFAYSEEFVLIKKDEEIVGMITVAIPTIQVSTVSAIGYLKVPEDLIAPAVKFVAENIQDIAVVEISKVKMQLVEGISNVNKVIDIFIENGFEKEAVLKKECDNKDVTIYSKIY
ncbi:PqqD family peptide modification chaperone [Cellulosilyticum ruminicola]|uniref:PqqD family peptide modification chaperone n=1 Tax=Cellulosilyticum ruminicola TaxID=425254 RepID=UPI0006CFD683|nr:PqqD family peptide modification chaperone [Cellulosilyticum ruminicola]